MILMLCIWVSVVFMMLAGIGAELSKKDEKNLKEERAALVAQAETFLESDDYELLPDLFTQIAELSRKLGEEDIADDFSARAKNISSLFAAPATPPSQDTPARSPPQAPSPAPATPSPISTTAPGTPPPTKSPTIRLPPAQEVMGRISERLQQLQSAVDGIDVPSVTPPSTTAPEQPTTIPTTPTIESAPAPFQKSPPPTVPPKAPDALIAQRRTEQGTTLTSGIVPTVVKDEREVLVDILTEKLPLIPHWEKEEAIEKILARPSGPQREAWLKVFLIKNKKYAKPSNYL